MGAKPIAKLRLEDLNNRPGLEMNGWEAVIVPYVTGAGAIDVPYQIGTVYTCLLKETAITTKGQLPNMGAIDYAAETTGDLLLVLGKITQEFV
jgi:hypothetical protein